MMNYYISFIEVKDKDFYDLMKYLNPLVKDYLMKIENLI